MNIKEIALAVNKTERSVRNWAKKVAEKNSVMAEKISASTSTHPADYDLEETLLIIETGLGKNAAALYEVNARNQTAGKIVSVPGTTLSKKDIEVISIIVAETVKKLDGRVSRIEEKIEERRALLPAPEMAPRDRINMIIRDFADRNKMPFSTAYGELYKIFNYTYNCNVNASAKNRGVAIIEYIESEGLIENLEAVAVSKFSRRTA
ncbi:MAG TPA: hypothetical protein PLA54_11270 [Spirochaetota bacterium]|nr:hypothetical protein [Spirochaetota bacterium]